MRVLMARLDDAIEKSEYLVADVKNFNRQQYPMRYPCLGPAAGHDRDARRSIPTVIDCANSQLHLLDLEWLDEP